ncbi:MAG: UDP-N-acetylmuramoyl-tripeptide--D-alanyl-D-alanine ligase [Syntrophobacterales bacterium]|nr:UDP-N-acetylmuramoyl-tripeptide--D-alanyl-D-alanine ligase [Syntrophobacterales bacterium]
MKEENLWTLSEVLKATGGELILKGSWEIPFKNIITDSRKMERDSIFIALPGERFDGHDFLVEALERGAQCFVIEKPLENFDAGQAFLRLWQKLEKEYKHKRDYPLPSVVKVGNTIKALGDLARYKRLSFNGPVIGITGSNGKTSTKEMIFQVLSDSFEVLKNPLNWNNTIGLPLSLLELKPHHRAIVLEMGINHPGEMDQLVAIAEPTIGVITNIQKAHLEGLGSEEVICHEKTKLWQALPKGKGCAVVNNDDPWLLKASEKLKDLSIIRFSLKGSSDVTVEGDIRCSRHGTSFVARYGASRVEVSLNVLGEHFVSNALASLAVGLYLNIPLEVGAERLSKWRPISHRMECLTLPDGSVIIDDSYNANPGSMLRAIETVSKIAAREKKPFIAVLGDMKELGIASEDLHRFIGRELAGRSPTAIFTIGDLAKFIAEEGKKAGIPTVVEASDHASLLEALTELWIPGAWLLVKGSRSMKMERIVEGLVADAET